jgi:hypothetical protein
VKRTVALRRSSPPAVHLPRRPPDQSPPVSFGQEQIWLHGALVPDVPLYTESLTIRHRGPLDVKALVRGFEELVRRHEIWRTTFAWAGDQLVQQVGTGNEPCVRVTDLRHLPPIDCEATALKLAREDLARPFDLSREPGVRGHLVIAADDDQRLFLCLHHMVFDGFSIYQVFLPDLVAIYQAEVGGETAGYPDEPPLQYGDYAYWQRHTWDEAALRPLLDYWRRQLAGAPTTIALPTDRPRPSVQSFRGDLVRFQLPPGLTTTLRSTAQREHCTLFMVLLAGFAAALHHWSGQPDLLIGSVSAGRERPELERLIGYFLRILVLRADLTGAPTFRELLHRIRAVLVEALCHDGVPFQQLVRAMAPGRDLSVSPLFQVTFSIEPPLPDLGPEWGLSEMDAGTAVSKFDLSIELEDRGEVIGGRAIYGRDLFDRATIEAFVTDYTRLLDHAAANPGARLAELPASTARSGSG